MTLSNIIFSIGIPVIAGSLIYIGRKLQVLDTLEIDMKSIRDRFIIVEHKMNSLWKDEVAPAHSPRKLNARGESILAGSGIKLIIDDKKNDFLAVVKGKNINNPYDAEQCVLQLVAELKKDQKIVDGLKTGAFSVGADIDTVLLVGGIYLRDQIFPDLGYSVEEIDKHAKA